MNRRNALLGLSGLLVALNGRAQQTQIKVARIGLLFAGTLAQRPQAQGFWQRLRELGYTPGKNVVIEVREAKGETERLPQLPRELVDWKPDVLVAVTPSPISSAQLATPSTPI